MPDAHALAGEVIDRTRAYLAIPSVVGHEKPFIDALAREWRDRGHGVERADNVLMIRGGAPESGYVSAHIDRHGLVALGGGDYRYAAHAVRNYKYNQAEAAADLSYLQTVCGQFSRQPVYAYGRWSGQVIAQGMIDHCHYCTRRANLIFHLPDMAQMPEGIPLAYGHDPAAGSAEELVGQIDNAVSVALIAALFEAGFQGTALLTAEEEIGKSWKHLAALLGARGIETRRLVVLDTTPYADLAAARAGKIVLRNRDASAVFEPALVAELVGLCRELDLPFEVKDEILRAQGRPVEGLGRTELGRLIAETGGRWSGATLQIPTTNYHTNRETTRRASLVTALRALMAYFRLAA